MAIYGVGAYYEEDVSDQFIAREVIGAGWSHGDAPELHQYFRSLKVGDIMYIKAAFGRADVTVKAIGVIKDDSIRTEADTAGLVAVGRNVIWLSTERFVIARPAEKNNVRSNTVYEEFHPAVRRKSLLRSAPNVAAADAASRSAAGSDVQRVLF